MKMYCFGDKVSSLHCKIVLLDEQQLVHEVHVNTTGQDVLNVVYQHLNLVETAYFGLRYVDASHQPQWLDPNKKVLLQMKGGTSHTLYFAVKFYAVDPCKLVEEFTRYQFFLQVKKDVLQGRLAVATDLAAELAALAIQSELGDYEASRYKPGYVAEFRFLAHQSSDLENKIAELHKSMRGLVPAVAEMRYLDRVKWLDLYGADLHPVLGEDTIEYFLGLTPSGIIVLRNKTKVGNYFWTRIVKIHFKGRYFMLRVRDKNNDESTFGFETPSKEACKSLHKCCSQHLAFFRLVQMSGPNMNGSSGSGVATKLLNFGGRAATLATPLAGTGHSVRSPPQFRRMPSRRHQRREVDGASHPAPQVDECSTSDSDKTLDAASTTLLSPYHAKVSESTPIASNDQWADSSVISSSHRSRRSRSHSRNRKDRRSSSIESRCSSDSRSLRRKSQRNRSRPNSDNDSEASRVSEHSRSGRRRSRHRSSRDSSGSESDHHSSHSHRSHHRNRRRGSHGSTYELIDSEEQWREVQERKEQITHPTASSTPQQQAVQQATVRKATGAASTLSANESTDVQANVETTSQASSRHRQHRKHHHRHEKHSKSSRSRTEKVTLPDEIVPHLQFELVEPPADSREIPYQVVMSPSSAQSSGQQQQQQPSSSSSTASTVVAANPAVGATTENQKRNGLYPSAIVCPPERKIVSVDNDSPPPPYSPPQNILGQNVNGVNVNRLPKSSADNLSAPPRPPQVPIGPKPARLLPKTCPNSSNIPNSGSYVSSSYSNGYRPPGSGVNSSNAASSRNVPISHQQATASSSNPVEYYMPNVQYQQRNLCNAPATSSAHRYQFSSAPSPNNIGLPIMNSYAGHHPAISSQSQADQSQQQQQLQQQQQYQQQQQHHQQMHPSALTLPRASVGNRPPPPLPGVDKGKLALPLSPLATGVTQQETCDVNFNTAKLAECTNTEELRTFF